MCLSKKVRKFAFFGDLLSDCENAKRERTFLHNKPRFHVTDGVAIILICASAIKVSSGIMP
jgi:hypothetical protein